MRSCKLLPVFLLWSLASFAQFGFPSFAEVATHFFTNYSYDQYSSFLRLQRKPTGWYVSLEEMTQFGTYTNTAMLWSKESRQFVKVDYPPVGNDTTGVATRVAAFLKTIDWDYIAYGFDHALYYGYPGWDWDVMQEPLNDAAASDTLLESKARAFSSYASGFVTDQFDFVFLNGDSDRTKLLPEETISHSRLRKLVAYDLKSIEYYQKLQVLNPAYNTKVGKAAIKTANEYMFLYYWLHLAGDTSQALSFARQAAYPDSILNLAGQYLQSLPQNSLLITGGDNDTYPVWYLQQVKHVRPDVLVINYSLLALHRQLLWFDRFVVPRLFTSSQTLYLDQNLDYSLYNNKTGKDQPLELGAFLKALRDNKNPHFDDKLYPDLQGTRTYYTKELIIKGAKAKDYTITLGAYLLLNDFLLLDLIHTTRRKIFSTFNIDLLAPMLQSKGMVYELAR